MGERSVALEDHRPYRSGPDDVSGELPDVFRDPVGMRIGPAAAVPAVRSDVDLGDPPVLDGVQPTARIESVGTAIDCEGGEVDQQATTRLIAESVEELRLRHLARDL